jgi:hypothetical protein
MANEFNFEGYNKIMETANTGLKVYLITQLLGDVVTNTIRYKSPLANEAMEVLQSAEELRVNWKIQSAKANAGKASQTLTAPKSPATPVADMNQYEPAVF